MSSISRWDFLKKPANILGASPMTSELERLTNFGWVDRLTSFWTEEWYTKYQPIGARGGVSGYSYFFKSKLCPNSTVFSVLMFDKHVWDVTRLFWKQQKQRVSVVRRKKHHCCLYSTKDPCRNHHYSMIFSSTPTLRSLSTLHWLRRIPNPYYYEWIIIK